MITYPAEYYFVYRDPLGVYQFDIEDFLAFDSVRKLNDYGTLNLWLPNYYRTLLKTDGRLEMWRSVNAGRAALEGDTSWLIRKPIIDEQPGDQDNYKVQAFDLNHLLTRRYVMYYTGSAQAQKTGYADNVIKDIVRENMGATASDYTGANARRQLAATLFTIQVNTSLGQTIYKTFPYRKVLTVIQDIAQDSTNRGTWLGFQVVNDGSGGAFEFRTFATVSGTDHTYPNGVNPVTLSKKFGNLANVTYIEDHSEEITAVFTGGQGEASARNIVASYDAARILDSPFAWIEDFNDARNTEDDNDLASENQAALRAGRPRQVLYGDLIDTPATRYGVNYTFGDILTVEHEGTLVNCRIEVVNLGFNGDRETVSAKVQSII